MSISSDSEPVYNEFYDQRSVSDGEDSAADFFLREQKPKTASTRVGRKQGERRGHNAAAEDPHGATGSLSNFLAPFQACCFGTGPVTAARYGAQEPAVGRQSTPLAQFIMQTSQLSDSPTSDTSTDVDDIMIGAAPQVVNTTDLRERRRSTRHDKDTAAKGDSSTIRQALREKNIVWKDLIASQQLDAEAKWNISATLQDTLATDWLSYTEEQKRLIALHWCRRIELSERMNARVLQKLLKAEHLPREVTIPQALKRIDDFAVLEYVRLVEARLIEEVMGEFQSAATSATNTSTIYLIISSRRTVAMSCRQQGEVLLINVFDTGVSQTRGPAFFGFDNAADTEHFLIDLFSMDPLVRSSGEKFSAWTLRSRHGYQAIDPDVDEKVENGVSEVKPVWDADVDEMRLNDPQYNAKLVYTEMYKATEKPTDQDEPVFTHSTAGGIQVQEPKKQ